MPSLSASSPSLLSPHMDSCEQTTGPPALSLCPQCRCLLWSPPPTYGHWRPSALTAQQQMRLAAFSFSKPRKPKKPGSAMSGSWEWLMPTLLPFKLLPWLVGKPQGLCQALLKAKASGLLKPSHYQTERRTNHQDSAVHPPPAVSLRLRPSLSHTQGRGSLRF